MTASGAPGPGCARSEGELRKAKPVLRPRDLLRGGDSPRELARSTCHASAKSPCRKLAPETHPHLARRLAAADVCCRPGGRDDRGLWPDVSRSAAFRRLSQHCRQPDDPALEHRVLAPAQHDRVRPAHPESFPGAQLCRQRDGDVELSCPKPGDPCFGGADSVRNHPTDPSTLLRAGPSTPLRAGPSTLLRAGPSTSIRAGARGVDGR